MTTYTRGRVALTPAYECNLREPAGDRFRWERTHVGHVRTLMLGRKTAEADVTPASSR